MSAKGSDIMASGGECRQPARRRQHLCARVFIRIGQMTASDSLRAASLSECTLDTVGVIPHRRKGNRDEVWTLKGDVNSQVSASKPSRKEQDR